MPALSHIYEFLQPDRTEGPGSRSCSRPGSRNIQNEISGYDSGPGEGIDSERSVKMIHDLPVRDGRTQERYYFFDHIIIFRRQMTFWPRKPEDSYLLPVNV